MQVEQKNIWEDVTRNAKRDNSNRAIAAYQANMPDAGAVAAFGGQEAYVQQKTAVSEAGNIDMATYSNPAKQGQEEKTVAEKIAGQEISSGQARSNEIAVVANTTSTEDLKKMEEDGFSISDADSHTIITVTDKIKAALAKAGVDVSSMGGTLTKEQLEEITGSPVVTQQIMDSLAANDLPATEENVQDSAEALAQAASIPEITKQAMSYLLKNDMEPTIRTQADGIVVSEEVNALHDIASYLGIAADDLNSMLNLNNGCSNLDAAYKVLGIASTASDDEVKAAYRKMALKHHPDRVATLGEDVRKAAEKKFQEINEAKEVIYKSRGL